MAEQRRYKMCLGGRTGGASEGTKSAHNDNDERAGEGAAKKPLGHKPAVSAKEASAQAS